MEQGVSGAGHTVEPGGMRIDTGIDQDLRAKRMTLLEGEQGDDAILGDLVAFMDWLQNKGWSDVDRDHREMVLEYIGEVT